MARSPVIVSSGMSPSLTWETRSIQSDRSESAAVEIGRNGESESMPGWSEPIPLGRSPLHRAGLLQPYSYNPSNEALDAYVGSHTSNRLPQPHSQDTIRQSSIKLSNMPLSPSFAMTPQSPSSAHGGSPSSSHTFVPRSPVPLSHLLRPDVRGRMAECADDSQTDYRDAKAGSEHHPPEDQRKKPSALTLLRPGFQDASSSAMLLTATPTSVSGAFQNGSRTSYVALAATSQIPEINIFDDDDQKGRVRTLNVPAGEGRSVTNERVRESVPQQEHGEGMHEPANADESERSTVITLTTPTLGSGRNSPVADFCSSHDPNGLSVDDHARSVPVGGRPVALDREPLISRKGSGEMERTERTPLLAKPSILAPHISYDGQLTRGAPQVSSGGEQILARLRRLGTKPPRFYITNKVRNVKDMVTKTFFVHSPWDTAITAMRAIPAVLLGCLLNVLDAVSYGMIIFPSTGLFSGLGPMGVSMFFLTTIISQLVYSLGGSSFVGANGSMMIEVVPFFHIMANTIADQIGEKNEREILATTLVAYAFSSILTGLAFLLLGVLKLGAIVGFFPRHILVGCIGGVGVFLILTGFTVSLRLDDSSFSEAPWETICYMFKDMDSISLWLVPFMLAVLLRVITSRWHHQLIFPIYFIVIPLVFYIIVLVTQLDLGDLRRSGWLFDVGVGSEVAWYQFYSYLDFGKVSFAPLWKTLPTQFALLFFNILHPPLNVPALSVSLNEDVDTNKELVAHGFSNLFAGLLGTVPNYLVYINTLLFYRVGGNNRISGFMLALATFGLLIMGTEPIAYLPVMVVGALIFVLGIDLVKEALWDTRHRTNTTEYITILSIMITMTVWDFVAGVLFGIIVCCFFFVVQSSQRRSIRAIQAGDTAMSSVRRPSLQREYIREVSKQTTVIKLQGFLFFGTIAQVEEAIRELIEAPSWEHNPIRYLVVDLSLVPGVDMSSAECFVRIHRLLYDKGISLVFCGIQMDSSVGKALRSVDVLGAKGVELFSTLNDAMEWTENEYLRTWYNSQKAERPARAYNVPKNKRHDTELSSLIRTPRIIQLRDAATKTLAHEAEHKHDFSEEPFVTLSKVFSTFGDISYSELYLLKSYLERLVLAQGHILWRQGDPPDGLHIVESGVLRAAYDFAERTQNMEETMFPGTLAGELSGLSETPRNATVIVERQAVLWKLSSENLRRLRKEEPGLAAAFTHLVLKSAKVDYDILLGALASRQ